MYKLPKLIETYGNGTNTIVEIWEEGGTLTNNPSCPTTFYTLKIISKDSRKFPVLTGAINEVKGILKRKIHRELHKIGTDFDLRGKDEKDQ